MAVRAGLVFHLTELLLLVAFLCFFGMKLPLPGQALGHDASGSHQTGLITVETETQDEDDASVTDGESESEMAYESNVELFQPTNEWQSIKKGQRIPPGLHVRMNFETGQKEARLLQESEDAQVDDQPKESLGRLSPDKKKYTRGELKQALKDFKKEQEPGQADDGDKEVKGKFRSYAQLKEAMEQIQLSVKLESEILKDLVDTLKKPQLNEEDAKTVLTDVEYYVHQIDNGRLFCDLGGMPLLTRYMNSSDKDVRSLALQTLGAAMQSNGKVQVEAVDNGVLQMLVRMVSVDTSFVVCKKSLFALSTLLRQFPFAQKMFLESGGVSVLADVFLRSDRASLRVKMVTLLTDLVQEHDFHITHHHADNTAHAQRKQQYSEVKVLEAMRETGWCRHLVSLLVTESGHDGLEKVLSSMTTLRAACRDEFSASQSRLRDLATLYRKLADGDEEGDGSFFASVAAIAESLMEGMHRDEL